MTILSAARLARLATEAWTAGGRVTFAAPSWRGSAADVDAEGAGRPSGRA